MKFSRVEPELDATDRAILELLQENCKQPLAAIGSKVGLSAPAVVDRIHKLEEAGVIRAYVALLDGQRLGKDVAAFIGVATEQPGEIGEIERSVVAIDDVLECHHVTGEYTLLLKVKTANTTSLERLISRIRLLDGVARTETLVVLSTHIERAQLALHPREPEAGPQTKRGRRNGNSQLRRA